MAYDRRQFRDLIERSLYRRDLHSPAAVNLLLGTAAKESDFGTFLRQLGSGPARGAFQVEPGTFGWLRDDYGARYRDLIGRTFDELEWDLDLGIVVARLRYRVVPEPLPGPDDIDAMAAYWKQYYNTHKGKGTVEQFVQKYHQYVLGKSP